MNTHGRPATVCFMLLIGTLAGCSVPRQPGSPPETVGEVSQRDVVPSAEPDDPESQYRLGVRYETGEGVPASAVEAAKWIRKAAEQGYGPGQYRLGMMYAEGKGVPPDYVLAHMWLNLAATRLTGDERRNAVNNRYMIARRMSPEQIAEAERLALDWRPGTQVRR